MLLFFFTRICSIYTHICTRQAHETLSLCLLITSGRKKEETKQQKKSKTHSRSARFGARLENVKVVFSLYRFVRGHRTDYADDLKQLFSRKFFFRYREVNIFAECFEGDNKKNIQNKKSF